MSMSALISTLLLLTAVPAPVCSADAGPPLSVSAGFEVCAALVPSPIDGEGAQGVLVTTLASDHLFARSGMRAGDVIVKVNGTRIRQVRELVDRLVAEQDVRDIMVVYRRDDLPLLARVGRSD